MDLPKILRSGFPEKEFEFSGIWEKVTQGNRRTALRNRKTVFVPIYRAKDGSQMLPMFLAVASNDFA